MAALGPSDLARAGGRAIPDNRAAAQEIRRRAWRPISSFRGTRSNTYAASLVAADVGAAEHFAQTPGAWMGSEYGAVFRCDDGCDLLFGR